jgi:hypothetical protein
VDAIGVWMGQQNEVETGELRPAKLLANVRACVDQDICAPWQTDENSRSEALVARVSGDADGTLAGNLGNPETGA